MLMMSALAFCSTKRKVFHLKRIEKSVENVFKNQAIYGDSFYCQKIIVITSEFSVFG